MALDVTLQETAFRKSTKKFFVDELYTAEGLYISFEKSFKAMKDDNGALLDTWVNFHFDGLSVRGNKATGRIAAYVFSRRDSDGMLLAATRDLLMSKLIDLTITDGLKRVMLYDDSWQVVEGMIVTTGAEAKEERGVDDTLYKLINIYFNYATV